MAKVRINGDTSGYIELASPAAAGSNTLTLPSSNGSANQLLKNSGTAGTLAWSTLTEDSSGNLNIDSGTLYVDASNNRVGIGTTSPGRTLDVVGSIRSGGSTNPYLALADGTTEAYFEIASSTTRISSGTSQPLTFRIGSSEAARIDTSNRFLVGTSSARSDLVGLSPRFQVEGTDQSTSTLSATRNSNDSGGPALLLAKSRGTSAGATTVVLNNDLLGGVYFMGADGTNVDIGAQITGEVDGTPGSNDLPSRLVFSTTADGASSPTERMRINSSGQILVNTTSASSGGFVSTTFFVVNSGGAPCAGFRRSDSSGTNEYIRFTDGDDTDCGSIDVNATANTTAYTTSSDYRLKQNVQPLQNTVARLKSLKPCSWEWINAPGVMGEGFIAHEAQAVVPESVTGAKDEVDADGKPIYQGIDQSKLVPLLTAALQEAIQKIQQLETLNASFEARLAALEVKP
jgi:hypothetical protein